MSVHITVFSTTTCGFATVCAHRALSKQRHVRTNTTARKTEGKSVSWLVARSRPRSRHGARWRRHQRRVQQHLQCRISLARQSATSWFSVSKSLTTSWAAGAAWCRMLRKAQRAAIRTSSFLSPRHSATLGLGVLTLTTAPRSSMWQLGFLVFDCAENRLL